jgi:outer membrane lipoprotein-sorting protein
MRKLLAAFAIATGAALVCCQSAGSAPVAATAIQEAALAASPVQQTRYQESASRHSVVKCYRFLIVGRYRCHYYRRW